MLPLSDVIPSRTAPVVTISLISANTLAFAAELALGDEQVQRVVERYGVVPARLWWPALLTSLFLHAGWVHFAGNMVCLWIFGDNIEDRLGRVRYLAFYVACGAAAALGQRAMDPYSLAPVIGASGAVAGVMGAYFVLYPLSRVLTAVFLVLYFDVVEVPALLLLAIWFVVQQFSGVGSIGAIAAVGAAAFWVPVVGFATGALYGALLHLRASPARRWD